MFDRVVKHKELIKTLSLTVLVTGVIAFVAGIKAHERYINGVERERAEAMSEVVKVDEVKQ